jgi:hypothetical protein
MGIFLSSRIMKPILALVAVSLVAGCQTLGTGSVTRDRMGYAAAIGDSWKEQMLLNIVKLRYLDTPVYLDISSVISSYSLASDVGIAANFFPRATEGNNLGLSATGRYSESPTISYIPLTGDRLVKSMLRPIPPETVFATIGGGGRADFILRAVVQAINGIYNVSTSPSRARRNDPRFIRVAEALRRIEEAGALGVRIETHGENTLSFVLFRRGVDEDTDADIALVKELLGLDPKLDSYRLVFGATRSHPDEIAVLTRSMQGVMGELAGGVEVPEQDMREGRATSRLSADGNAGAEPLMRISSGGERPADAYAAVSYRNRWFWIDDRDLSSKRTFRFLMMFASLAETGGLPQAPILTIPAR